MAQSQEGTGELIDQILEILRHAPLLDDYPVLQQEQAPGGEFTLKIRCRIRRRFVLQIRVRSDLATLRYSYRFLSGTSPILRWDNAPHFPDLENFPHHKHDPKGNRQSSQLLGEPSQDLLLVLKKNEGHIETQT